MNGTCPYPEFRAILLNFIKKSKNFAAPGKRKSSPIDLGRRNRSHGPGAAGHVRRLRRLERHQLCQTALSLGRVVFKILPRLFQNAFALPLAPSAGKALKRD